MDNDSELEFLYKEYARLGEKMDGHINASLAEFKLYWAIGVLLVWHPAVLQISALVEGINPAGLLFAGFVAVLVIVGALSIRRLLRVSIIRYHIVQMQHYEAEIRARLTSSEEKVTFHFAGGWGAWETQAYSPVARTLIRLCMAFIALYPSILLWLSHGWELGIAYFLLFFVIGFVYWLTERKVRNSLKR